MSINHPLAHRNRSLSTPKSQRFLRFAIAMPIADPRNRSEFRDKRKGGAFDPAASSRPPPGQRSHSVSYVEDAVRTFGLFSVWVVFAWMCASLCALCPVAVLAIRDRRRAGSTSFWGSSFLSGMLLVLAPPGAVPVVGGFSDPSVPRSPGVSPQKAQGGPLAPPPCSVKFSETC